MVLWSIMRNTLRTQPIHPVSAPENMTKRKRKPTSHDEEDEQFDQEGVSFKPSDLWDDNQLVDSWEGVLEEYKVSRPPSSIHCVYLSCLSTLK